MYKEFTYPFPLTLNHKGLYSLRNKLTGEEKHHMTFHFDNTRSEVWGYFVFTNHDSKVVIKRCGDDMPDWQYRLTHTELE